MAEPPPICLLEVEVGAAPTAIPARAQDGRAYGSAAVLVRLHGLPLGVVELPLGGRGRSAAADLAERVDAAFGARIESHLSADGDGPMPACRLEHERRLARAPRISVIVATRGGDATLGACLDSILDADYRDFEVLVVESASGGDGVRRLVEARADRAPVPLRHLTEPRPGLALAHNRGLAAAGGAIVAFTDDDVVIDRLWLARIAAAFEAGHDVACVTGLILPFELESPAQVWLDGYWGLGKGFERRCFDADTDPRRPLHPYTAGVFGSGANMAFRTDALRAVGGFDPALGAGSAALGGDDLAAFFDVLAAGHRLVYEPTAVVRHRHRPGYDSLRRQAYGYGAGLTAYLAKVVADDPRQLLRMAARARHGIAHVLAPSSAKNAGRPAGYPSELMRIERRGMAAGPLRYARSRRRIRAQALR